MSRQKSVLYLHLSVMFFGLSGVIGQFVQIPAVLVAGGRVLCSTALLLILSLASRAPLRLHSRRDLLLTLGTGVVLAVHWTAFFQSIQLSSVAIGTITYSTFPLFVTFLEPLLFHEKLRLSSVLSALVLLLGVLITIPEFSAENQVTAGILWGMLSSLAYAVMSLSNRYLSASYPSRTICLYEQGTAAVVLLPAFFLVPAAWTLPDLAGVAAIGFVCTAFAHTLYVEAQKRVTAQTAGIVSGMETVYGILFALLLLGEVPTLRELVGGGVILSVALLSSLSSSKAAS